MRAKLALRLSLTVVRMVSPLGFLSSDEDCSRVSPLNGLHTTHRLDVTITSPKHITARLVQHTHVQLPSSSHRAFRLSHCASTDLPDVAHDASLPIPGPRWWRSVEERLASRFGGPPRAPVIVAGRTACLRKTRSTLMGHQTTWRQLLHTLVPFRLISQAAQQLRATSPR